VHHTKLERAICCTHKIQKRSQTASKLWHRCGSEDRHTGRSSAVEDKHIATRWNTCSVLEITKEKPLKSSSQTVGCGWSGGGSGRAEHGHSPGTILQKRLQLGRASRPLARQPNCLKTKMPAPPQSTTLNCHPQPQQRRPVAPHAVGKLPRAAIRILHMEWNNQPEYARSSMRVVRAGRCHSAQHDGNVARLCCAQARVYESGATWQRHPHNRNPLLSRTSPKGCPKHQGHKGDPGVTPGLVAPVVRRPK